MIQGRGNYIVKTIAVIPTPINCKTNGHITLQFKGETCFNLARIEPAQYSSSHLSNNLYVKQAHLFN